mmetsp:Transcript_24426/g.58520  ORF Transcript_24426/g.58520 Transcript_24426/m.58520 type:complete len:497 (+) Transcript_24426:101-1591(+)
MVLIDPLGEDLLLGLLDGLLDVVGRHLDVRLQVLGVLPREEGLAVLGVRRAAEVAVRGGDVVLRLAKLQVARERAGARVEVDLHDVGDRLRGQVTVLGAVGLDEEGERLGDADGVRQLHARALAQARRDDGLGHPAARVGRRAVDLGRVLAREGAAAVRAPAAVGINDDLAAGQAGVALRAADDELARRVDVQVARLAVVQRGGGLAVLQLDRVERREDHVLVDRLVHVGHGRSDLLLARVLAAHVLAGLLGRALLLERLGVLGGDDDRVDLLRLDRAVGLLHVLDRDLRLAVRAQPPERAVLAHVGELLAQAGRDQVRQRHAVGGLVRRVAEHDALVAGADVQVGLAHRAVGVVTVHAAGDVGRLLVDAHEHLAGVAREALGRDRREVVHERVEADLTDLLAHDLVVVQLRLRRDLAEDHHHVVLGGSLARDLGHRVLGQAGIQDGVRDLVGELVGVALVHRLRREQEDALLGGHLLLLGGHGCDVVFRGRRMLR